MGAFSIGNALPHLNAVASAVGVASSMKEIIERKVTIDPYSVKGLKPAEIFGTIEFKNVSFCYPSRPEVSVNTFAFLDKILI